MAAATFKIADFAREHGIDPKKARGALRRNMRADSKKVPLVLDGDSKRVAHTFNDPWTFPLRERDRVARLIMTDAQFAKYSAKAKKAKPEPVDAPTE
jgi:hypothetical protein